MITLAAEEARVLGCLIEKAMTTPEYYPLTANALTAACNQKSSRDPVMSLDETSVVRTVEQLTDQGLAGITRSSGGRAVKYLHRVTDRLEIDDEQAALIAVLLLRGPQTPGELRSRTERYVEFASVDNVEARLSDLITRTEPLVERLAREPGRRESRYRCLLTEPPSEHEPAQHVERPPDPSGDLAARVEALEARIARLESELGLEPED